MKGRPPRSNFKVLSAERVNSLIAGCHNMRHLEPNNLFNKLVLQNAIIPYDYGQCQNATT